MTHGHPPAPIVVGVDGSPAASDAVAWAAVEAAARRAPLRLVHGFIWPLMNVPLGPPVGGPAHGGLQAQAERLLQEAEEAARAVAPDVEITTRLVTGAAVAVLLREARDADLLVLGHRGMGGFLGLLVGSVGVELAAHAPCPVVVVRPRPADGPAGGGVVVGVDGSEDSDAALDFAFETAARRGVGLTAVRGWDLPTPVHPSLLAAVEELEDAERQALEDRLRSRARSFPDVRVRSALVRGHPGHALVAESAGADLVVVGSRGRGGFRGLLLGSVGQSVLHHAPCPVAVVRGVDAATRADVRSATMA